MKRRHSLFARIFGWFWATMALIVVVVAALEFITPQPPLALVQRRLIEKSLQVEAGQAYRAWKRGGVTALQSELARFEAETGVQAYLIEAGSDRDASGEALNAPIPAMLRRSASQEGIRWRAAGLQVTAVLPAGEDAYFAVRFNRGPFSVGFYTRRLLRILAVLITAGLVCWLLARSIVQPIMVLRGATQRFATGDFSSRAILPPKARQDELAMLAADFNGMASRIEALIRAQKRLVGDVSHELRTPLTRLKIALALARRDAPPIEPLANHLDRIDLETQALDQLVGELLLLFRLENRIEPGPGSQFDWARTVERILSDLRWEADNQDRPVNIELEALPQAVVVGEEALLARALENIARNALRYAPDGSTIRIQLRQETDNFVTEVSDEGPGVPADQLDSIFEPFYRVDSTRERAAEQSGGAGLGLAIARRAVILNGGSISASNRESGGLSVRIELPKVALAV